MWVATDTTNDENELFFDARPHPFVFLAEAGIQKRFVVNLSGISGFQLSLERRLGGVLVLSGGVESEYENRETKAFFAH